MEKKLSEFKSKCGGQEIEIGKLRSEVECLKEVNESINRSQGLESEHEENLVKAQKGRIEILEEEIGNLKGQRSKKEKMSHEKIEALSAELEDVK